MEKRYYYHIESSGEAAPEFIVCENDFVAAMNRIAVCAANSTAKVVAFSIEETHPHFLLFGTVEECREFAYMFERSTIKFVANSRGSTIDFRLQILPVDSEEYLMNVGTYVIVQPTKDHKPVMPYDYLWGTASLYFRKGNRPSIWHFSLDGALQTACRFGELSVAKRRNMLRSRRSIPEDWLVCNGIVLPENYVDIERFEKIYATHNCFRTFLGTGYKAQEQVRLRISAARGVEIDDLEAQELCAKAAARMFGIKNTRNLNVDQRVRLALFLRHEHRLSTRQLVKILRIKRSSLDAIF